MRTSILTPLASSVRRAGYYMATTLAAVTWCFDGNGRMLVWTWDTVFLHPMWGQVAHKMLVG